MRHRTVQLTMVLLLGFGLVLTGVAGFARHVPDLERATMINDHGHSHDIEADLAWAGHGHSGGHSHDGIDHDHQTALILPIDRPAFSLPPALPETRDPGRLVSTNTTLIERPPIG